MTDSSSLITHIHALRKALLKSFACVFVFFIGLVFFADDLYVLVANPLISQLPNGSTMIAIDITSPFIAPIKLTAFVAFVLAAPYVIYQIWSFISPGLYKKEKRLVLPLMLSSTILFYIGILFAFFAVLPLIFYFFITIAPQNIAINTDITKYLDFVTTIFLVFGFMFELPVAIVIICAVGITSYQSLKKKRPYVIVGSFAIAMFLTPPDVFSQTLLAVPMCILFEIGLLFSRLYQSKNE